MEIQQGQQQGKDEQEKRQQQRQQIYQSLALGLKQIRLLRLYPSSDPKSEIACGQKQIGYDALSYTWGDPAATQRIRLNNSAFFVTQNLCEALRQLRLATRPRVVWADACCINQEDNVEKASQVGMMFDIYLKATQTVVWLGACTMDIDPVFNLINKINDLGLYEQGQIVKVASIRNAALSLFERTEWFQRTWVRQEIHAGREVQIICGRYSCNFEDFQAVMDGLLPSVTDVLDIFQAHQNPKDRAYRARLLYYQFKRHCNAYYHPEHEMDKLWFRIIMRSTLYEATLPQDRVFALIGVIATMTKNEYGNRTEGFPSIDYTKPASLVFQDFVKHSINSSGSLDCLSFVQNREDDGQDLPSWAVDLRRNVPRYVIPDVLWSFPHRDGMAREIQDFALHGSLRISGWPVAMIDSTVSPWASGLQRDRASGLTDGHQRPCLRSCFSSEDYWEPRKGGNKGMEEIFSIFQKHCSYIWVGLEVLESSLTENLLFSDRPPTDNQCVGFVTHQAQKFDLIVCFIGSSVPLLVRPTQDGRYTLLGPVLLLSGFIQKTKDGKEVFKYELPRCSDLSHNAATEFEII